MVSGVSSSSSANQILAGYRTGKSNSVQGQTGEVASQTRVNPVAKTAVVHRERANPLGSEHELPTVREGVDFHKEATLSRGTAYTEGAQLQAELGQVMGELSEAEQAEVAKNSANSAEVECECCKNRKYVDGSDDASVSYQTPTHISPENSAAQVRAHEQEHVVNEQLYAAQEGKEVLSQSVRLDSSLCPECGRSYTSGGMTTTVTAKPSQVDVANQNKVSLTENQVDDLMGFVAS